MDCPVVAPYVEVLAPTFDQPYVLRFRSAYHSDTDHARVYYTTDGSAPAGALGNASNAATRVVTASYSCVVDDGGPLTDICLATIPPLPPGTVVSYIVSTWSSTDSLEIFGNGGTCGVCPKYTNSVQATRFQYSVLPAPTITSQPQSRTNIAGTDATFSVTASGIQPLSYQWYYSQTTPLAGGTNSVLLIANVQQAQAGDYRVIVSGKSGSVTSSVAVLTVKSPPVITQQPASLTVNQGATASFTVAASGEAPLTYQWYFANNAIGQATNPTLTLNNVQPNQGGNYSVVIMNVAGSSTSQVAVLSVRVPPSVSQQPVSLTVTQGATATFSVAAAGTPPLSYQWYLGGVAVGQGTNGTLVLNNVQASQAGNYAVIITNLAGSVTSQVASLTVLVPPAISQQPVSVTVNQGASATFSVIAGGTAPLSYQWYFSNNAIGLATNPALTLNNVQPNQGGNYFVVVMNAAGRSTSQVAVLSVRVPPSISQQPVSLSVTQGATATFSVGATGTPLLSFQWYLGGVVVGQATNATLVLSNVQPSQAGNYTVIITNLAGSVTSQVASLTLLAAPKIIAQPISQTVLVGASYTFSVTASGDGPLSYQWRLNGSDLSGQNAASLPLTNIQPGQAGKYSVSVSSPVGSALSRDAILSVRTTSDPVYPNPDGGWAYLYNGASASASVTNGLDGTWNRQNGTDSWTGDGRGTNNGLPGGIGATNGILTIEDAVTVGTGSLDNRRFYLTHNLAQESNVTNATTLLNDGITLTFRARLTPPAPDDPLTELPIAPSGFMNVSDGKGMFGIRQAGSGGMLISFSLNEAIEDTSTNTSFDFGRAGLHMNFLNGDARSPNVDPGEGGATNLLAFDPALFHEFWITIQDNGPAPGTHRVSIYLDGSKTPSVFNVTAGTGSDGPATNYLALGLPSTPQRGAVDVDFLGYKPGVIAPSGFNDPVGIVQQPGSQTIAAGQVASFNVGVTGAPPYSFQWYKNALPISQATNAAYTTPPATTADAGASFVMVVANLFNSVTSSPAILSLFPPPVIVSQPQSLTVSYGDPASFSISVQSQTIVSYRWRFNGGDLPNETNSVLTIASAQPSHAGGYDVVAANIGGSITSAVATLTVNSYDFGDAPAPYPTLRADNGARHIIVPGVYLGAGIDVDVDGQPDAAAMGDDLGDSDDEDGVAFLSQLFAGRLASVQVVASTNGVLNAWLDCNGNGSWADPGEQIFTNQPVLAGTNLLAFVVSPGANAPNSFARFRFSTLPGLSFLGPAADGEVEDYSVSIFPAADLAVLGQATPNPVAVGSPLSFIVTLTNAGPSTATGVGLTNTLAGNFNFVSAVSSQGSCSLAGNTVTCSPVNLPASTSVTVTIVLVPTAAGSVSDAMSVGGNEMDFLLSNNNATITASAEVPPSIVAQPASLTVTQGNNVVFTVSASGTAPLLLQWRRNGQDLTGQTNASLSLNNVQVTDAGTYTARVRNHVGEVFSTDATLGVLAPPVIVTQPQSRTNLAGGTASLSVSVTGTEPLTYQWFFNQSTSLPATNATLTFANVQKTRTGDYTVVVRNSIGVVTSQTARLTVLEMDFGDAPDPFYPTLLGSNGARHRIVPGYFLGAGVDYEPDGQPDGAGSGDDLNPAGANDEDGVVFSGPILAGQVAGIGVTASSNGLLNAWIDFNANGGWADAGEQIFTNKALAAGSNFLTFRVPPGVVTTNSFARFRFSSAGGLSFVGEALDGEVEDYAVGLSAAVDLALSASLQPDPVAVGNNLVFTILVTNRGPSTANLASLTDLLPQGSLFVSASSTRGSCGNASGTVVCSLGNLPAGATALITITCAPLAPGGILTNLAVVTSAEYDLTPTDNSSALSAVSQEYPVIVAQPASLTVTNGNAAGFVVTAVGTALTYQWRFNGGDLIGETNTTLIIPVASTNQQGTYTVLARNSVGDVLSAPAVLTMLVPPRITLQPQGRALLAGSNVTLSVVATGTEPLSYQWLLDGANVAGGIAPNLLITNFQAPKAGTYTVRISNQAGVVVSEPAVLALLTVPIIVQQPQSQTVNAGGPATLTVVATGTEPLTYQWFRAFQGLIDGATNSVLVLTNAQKSQSGNYFVVVRNGAGMANSATATLTIVELDFGDAPDALGYPTLSIFNGARHQIVPGVFLGNGVDFEPDGQPNDTATGDDLNGSADEDGIVFTSPLRAGQIATVDVIASTNGFLDGWIDFDRNGAWTEFGEQVFTSRALVAGINHLFFNVPAQTVVSNTWARFRFSTQGHLTWDGPAPDGEVEDYQVLIEPAIDLGIALAATPNPVILQSNVTFTVIVSNQGPSTASGVVLSQEFPPGASFVTASSSQGSCTNVNGVFSCQLDALPSGAAAVVSAVVNLSLPGVQTSIASVTATEFESKSSDNVATATVTAVGLTSPNVYSGPIDGQDAGPANPYPATILVSGLTSTVYKVTVTLYGVSHTFPGDFDILLVGPRGQNVILMSDAGSQPIQGIDLTFDDASPLSLPETGRIVSETYRPTNYGSVADAFAAPAPSSPYGAQLSVFVGTDANGPWSLYVVDDQAQDAGQISGGWSLNFTTLKPISDLALGGLAIPDPVALGSNMTWTVTVTNLGPSPANGVTLTNALPSGTTLISATSSQGNCSNSNGLVTCKLGNLPVGGVATVILTMTPGGLGIVANTAGVWSESADFNASNNLVIGAVTVKPLTDLRVAGAVSPDPAQVSQMISLTWLLTNAGPNLARTVHLTGQLDGITFSSVSSSQGTCGQADGIVTCDLDNLPAGASATVTILGSVNRTGTITNRATVTSLELDLNFGDNVAQQVSSVLAVSPPVSNPNALSIAAVGPANPYPSTIQVAGLTAAVFKVSVTLSNLAHPFPDDLDILLVGPGGQKSLLMSDAGGSLGISGATLTFDDAAPASLPDSGQIVPGIYKPTDFELQSDSFAAPAPAGPYAASLSVFKGTDPNGTWALYVMSDQSHGSGAVASGWSLSIATTTPLSDLAIGNVIGPNPVALGSNVVCTISVTNLGPYPASGVTLRDTLPANLSLISAVPTQGGCATSNGLVDCALGNLAIGATASVTILASATSAGALTNFASVISQLNDPNPLNNNVATVVASGNAPVLVVSPLSQTRTNHDSVVLSASATGSVPLLYQWEHNGTVLPNATNRDLTLTDLAITDAGTYRVRVSNFVGSALSASATLTVLSRPTISPIANVITDEDTPVARAFTVGDVETAAANLLLSVNSSNPALTPAANLALSGSGANRTLTVLPMTNQPGTATITVTVTDGDGLSASTSFLLTFRPVNDPPVISPIGDLTLNEDTSTGLSPFLIADVETSAANLILSVRSSNTSLVSNAGITLGGNGPNRTLNISPAPDQFGSTLITLAVTDENNGSGTMSFLAVVKPVNDPPTLNPLNNLTINEDAGLQTVSLSGISAGPPNETQSLAIKAVSSNQSLLRDLTLTYANPTTNGTLTFSPAPNAFGATIITVVADDGQTENSSISRSFTVTVNPVNDAPTLDPIFNVTVSGDAGPQVILLTGVTSGAANENDTLQFTALSSNPGLVPNPTITYTPPNGFASLRFVPQPNASGVTTISVGLIDSQFFNSSMSRAFLITVLPFNHAPVISPIANAMVNQNTAVGPLPFTVSDLETPAASLAVMASVSNPFLLPPSNIVFGSAGSNRTVTLLPATNQLGTALVTLTVTDGGGSSASTAFQLTVSLPNSPPTLGNIADVIIDEDAGTQTVSLNGIGSGAADENQVLAITATSSNPLLIPDPGVNYLSPDANGTLIFAPLTNATGTATITVTVDDGQSANNTVTTSFTVTVNPVNDPPALNPIPDMAINEDAAPQSVLLAGINSGAVDENQTLVITATSGNPALIANPTVGFTNGSSTGVLTLSPLPNATGVAVITVMVNDGDASNNVTTRTFKVFVNPVDDPPTITAIPDQSVPTGSSSAPIAFGVGDIDTPLASLALTASSSNPALVPPGSIVFAGSEGNRTVAITSAANQTGTARITITVRDTDGLAASTNFLVTVTPVASALAISSIANQKTDEDTPLSIPFTVSTSSGGLGNLTLSASSSNPALAPVANIIFQGSGADRSVTITPLLHQTGIVSITLTVTDGATSANTTFALTVLPVNDLPTISNLGNLTINEDTVSSPISFTIGDVETPAGSLIVTGSSSNPTLIPNPNLTFGGSGGSRTLTIQPATNQVGTATITVTVSDDNGGFATNSFLLTVNPVNDLPTISSIANQTMNEDSSLAVPFTVGDAETLPHALSVSASSSNPALIPAANILFDGFTTNRVAILTPVPNQFGTSSITLTVSDGLGTNSTSFALTVAPVNDFPTLDAIPNRYLSLNPGTTSVSLTGISSGAANESQTLAVSASTDNPGFFSTQPGVSYSSANTTGTLTFRPASSATGSVLITVTVSDGTNTFSRTLTVFVRPSANTGPPTVTTIPSQTISEDGATAALAFTVGDSQTPANLLSVTGASSNPNLVPNTNIVFGGNGANRTVTVTPLPNKNGTATITVSVTDTNFGGVDTSFLLTVNAVNDAPVISGLGDQTISEDTPTLIPFSVMDAETAANSITVSVTSSNLALIPNANISFGGSGTNRVMLVSPSTNQVGTSLITLTANDGSSTVNTSFRVTVNGVNDPPTISAVPNQTINEDAATPALTFTINDLETPSANLSLSGTSSNPALVPNQNILFGGSGANRTVTITPLADQNGTTAITLTVSDGSATASSAFLLTVVPVNDPPRLDAISNIVTNQNAGQQTTNLTGITAGPPNEIQPLTVSAVSSNPNLIPNPVVTYTSPNSNGSLTFAPLPGAAGVATITVTVNDGQAQNNLFSRAFTVTISATPSISDIPDQTINEDTASSPISFTVSDVETPSANLVVTARSSNPTLIPDANILASGSGSTRTLTLLPAADQFGFATITVSAADGEGNISRKNFVLIVNPVNDPPTLDVISNINLSEDAGPQVIALTGIGSGAANEMQILTVTAVSSAPLIIPNPIVQYTSPETTGVLVFASAPNATGTADITVTVNDGQVINNSGSRTFRVTITPVNDAPIISPLANQVTAMNTALGPIPFMVSDIDTPSASLSVSASSSNPQLLPVANITLSGTDSNRTITLLPATNQFGSASVTLTVSDGAASASTTFQLTVPLVNNPPTISAIADQNINEDSSAGPIAFTINDTETPAASLLISATSSNQGLLPATNVVLGGSGANRTLTLTPLPNQFGTSVVAVTVIDTNGGIAGVSFKLIVNPVNDPPTLNPINNLVINQDAGTQYVVLSGLSIGAPNEGQTLSLSVSNNNPALLTNLAFSYVSPEPAGLLTFRTVPDASGVATLAVTANDGGSSNNVATRTFTVTVLPANDAPVISDIPDQTVKEDTGTGPIPFTISDAETPANNLVVTVISLNSSLVPASNLALTGSGNDRSLSILPAANQFGSAVIVVSASDGILTASKSMRLTVNSVNDAPTLDPLPDLTLQAEAGLQTVSLTGIGSGAANENQVLIVSAISDAPTLIPNPAVQYGSPARTGILSFTPVANARGSAFITVTVKDDGGILNGGIDNFSRVFRVTVPPTAANPTLQISRVGFVNQLSLATEIGRSYTVEYKNSLSDGVWNLLGTLLGNGQVMTLTDGDATATKRFYRARSQQ